MHERQSDFEWLQQFARAGNQSAFRELVRRHIDLVFATALRKVGDAGGAEEISQNVFGVLARKAWQFAPDDSLPAWLHKTALLESQAWQRGEMRRRRREEAAAELGTTMKTPDEQPAFHALVPLLDEALLSLREKDREALLLRYYESQSLRDVGAALNVSDDTAQKRVQSALEKLSQFFQRRGFKTATVAATTAALQHTASSASAATVSLVFNAALQAAPPVLIGVSAWFARLASLTKLQTAAVCTVIVTAAVAWQWQAQDDLRNQARQAQSVLNSGQTELESIRAEVTTLKETKAKRETELEQATAAAQALALQAQSLGDWKARLRERLLAADYQWPADLSLVRIPKAAVPQMDIGRPILLPGKVATEAREMLGLSPEERRQIEALLQDHFATVDRLAEQNFYQTNSAARAYTPKNAIVSNVWVVPKLGDDMNQQVMALTSGLENILQGDRWAMIKVGMSSSGMGTMSTSLNLGAADTRTEIAGWLIDNGGELSVSFHMAGDIHDSGAYWSSGAPMIPIRALLADDLQNNPANGYSWVIQESKIPQPVKESMLAWARQMAVRFNEGGAK